MREYVPDSDSDLDSDENEDPDLALRRVSQTSFPNFLFNFVHKIWPKVQPSTTSIYSG